jgi:hypothetical protein
VHQCASVGRAAGRSILAAALPADAGSCAARAGMGWVAVGYVQIYVLHRFASSPSLHPPIAFLLAFLSYNVDPGRCLPRVVKGIRNVRSSE